MDLLLEKILSIVGGSLAILLLIVSEQMFKINRKKAITSFILSLIYTGFAGYYIYLSFYVKTPKSILKKEIAYSKPSFASLSKPQKKVEKKQEIFLVFEINGQTLKSAIGDEIEISKKTRFKIKRIETDPPIKGIKANFIGFIGNPRYNDGQDIGYWIRYNKLRKNKSIDKKKEKFEIVLKKGKKIFGKVYVKFID